MKDRTEFRNLMIQKAMTIVEKEGIENLSLRKLASALNYSTMKLYSECGGKPNLLILLAEEICSQQNTLLSKVPTSNDPIDYLLKLTLATSHYYTDKPWTAEILRIVRFELEQEESTPAFKVAASNFRVAMKATNLPITKTKKSLDEALNIIRALMLGAISLISPTSDANYKKQVVKIIDNGMKTLIAGWR